MWRRSAGRGHPDRAVVTPGAADGEEWLAPLALVCLRTLIVGLTAAAALYIAARLRLVVLPVLLALVLTTLLYPAVGRLKARGVPAAAAALLVLAGSLASFAVVVSAVVPRAVDELDDLDLGITGGIDIVQRWASDGVLGISGDQLDTWLQRAEEQIRDNASGIAQGAVSGATLLLEVIVGLSLALVLLFFLLKDGERIWGWVIDLVPSGHRDDARAIGDRAWATLGGYLRGVTLVALFDAVFIALTLIVVGVPFVLPLALLTFIGAYVPIVGAFVAGLAAVLVALVALGTQAALVVAAAVVVVQQVESNFFQPVVVGCTVRVHPVAILLAVTAGGVLGGIIGAIIATPIVGVAAAVLRYLRFERPTEANATR